MSWMQFYSGVGTRWMVLKDFPDIFEPWRNLKFWRNLETQVEKSNFYESPIKGISNEKESPTSVPKNWNFQIHNLTRKKFFTENSKKKIKILHEPEEQRIKNFKFYFFLATSSFDSENIIKSKNEIPLVLNLLRTYWYWKHKSNEKMSLLPNKQSTITHRQVFLTHLHFY